MTGREGEPQWLDEAFGAAGREESLPMRAALDRVRGRMFDLDVPRTQIDRFELLGVVGRGASGVVYAAYDPQLHRKIALKVFPRQTDPHIASRVRHEARLAAGLNHPNIVTVFGFGDSDGRLWVAMELVEGKTLRKVLDTELATPPRRWTDLAAYLVPVAAGIDAAHRHGVIHRDIKPDNVLVGESGRVVLADFGLAAQSTHASSGGTPAYMSPEHLQGADVGAASDQFAFCVTAFEAVLGRRPFCGDTPEAMLEQMRRGPGAALAGAELPRRVLAVLTRGLAFQPSARFASMSALIAALQPRRRVWPAAAAVGCLAVGAALWARPDAATCDGGSAKVARVWNETRRATLADAFGAVDTPRAHDTWQRIEPSLDELAAGWAAVHRDACQAAQQSQDPGAMLDQRMDCLAGQLVGLDAVVATLAGSATMTVDHAVAMVESLPAAHRCLAPLDDKASPPMTPESSALRDAIIAAEITLQAGDHAEAAALGEALAARAKALSQPQLRARALVVQGSAELFRGRDAKAPLEEAVFLAAAADDSTTQINAALNLATAQRSDPTQAKRWISLANVQLARGGGTPRLRALVLDREGSLLALTGDRPAAAARFDAAYAILGEEGAQESDVGARLLNNIAQLAVLEHRVDDALPMLHRVLAIRQRVLGPRHPAYGASLAALGTALTEAERYDEAEPVLRQALDVLSTSVGEDHMHTHKTRAVLGALLMARGDLAGARVVFERWMTTLDAAHPDGHPEMLVPLSNLGSLDVRAGRLDEAAAAYWRVIDYARHHDVGPLALSKHLEALAEVRQLQARNDEALSLFQEAVNLQRETLEPRDAQRLSALLGVGASARALGKLEPAREALEEALALNLEDGGAPVPRARAEIELAHTLLDVGAHGPRMLALVRAATTRLDEAPEADVAAVQSVGLLDRAGLDALARRCEQFATP